MSLSTDIRVNHFYETHLQSEDSIDGEVGKVLLVLRQDF